MSDMGDDFRAWDKLKREKRAKNKMESTELLIHQGIDFISRNNGAHLIVDHPDTGIKIDFWPSTGKWRSRDSKQSRRGVFNMLRFMNVNCD